MAVAVAVADVLPFFVIVSSGCVVDLVAGVAVQPTDEVSAESLTLC